MEYKDIQTVNRRLTKMDIKGREYVQVHARVQGFRMLFPNGQIITELISHEDGVVIFRASAIDDGKVLSTGYALEEKGTSGILASSFVEVCESSAVGRCLGFLGIGIDCGISSYEEVANAEQQQAENLKIGKARASALEKELKDRGIDVEKVKTLYKVAFLSDLTERYHRNIVGHFDDLKRMSDGM